MKLIALARSTNEYAYTIVEKNFITALRERPNWQELEIDQEFEVNLDRQNMAFLVYIVPYDEHSDDVFTSTVYIYECTPYTDNYNLQQ